MPAPRPRRSWCLLAVLLAGVTLASAACSDGNRPARPAAPPTTGGPGGEETRIDPAGQELLDLLARSRLLPVHARYRARLASSTDDDPAAPVMELWRKPPRVRQDSVVEGAGQRTHVATFQLPSGNVRCVRNGTAPWSCAPVAGGPGDQGADDIVKAVTEQLSGRTVTVRDEVVHGEAGRCFTISGPASVPSELCVTAADGIPLRVASATARLEVEALEREVPDSVFELPADVR